MVNKKLVTENNVLFKKLIEDYEPSRRRQSLIADPNQLTKIASALKQERNKHKKQSLIRRYFEKSNYFLRLFPVLKEQKPGKDMYASITFAQFIIVVYLIAFYTSMDAEGTQNLENSSQFSFNMVILLFL